jgi:hypothetical protein
LIQFATWTRYSNSGGAFGEVSENPPYNDIEALCTFIFPIISCMELSLFAGKTG